jgi:predicted nucleotidyltransferase
VQAHAVCCSIPIELRGDFAVKRQRALELLAQCKPELQARFGVTRLALFGSTARDKATHRSDVDVLVAFDGPATAKRYFGVQFYIEDLFGCPVDLVTEKAVRKELRPYIEQERVNV